MGKILRIPLKPNSTRNALGCYGLKQQIFWKTASFKLKSLYKYAKKIIKEHQAFPRLFMRLTINFEIKLTNQANFCQTRQKILLVEKRQNH